MSSTADTDDVIEVSADGLTVRKRFAADEFPVPAIRFEIESDHEEPVASRLSEEIPESFPMDKVGFHPGYYSDDWTAFQDNHVEFTGTLEPGESLVTVYGIRIDDESVVSEFLTEPTIVEVSSDDDDGSDADAIDDDVIGTIVSDDGTQAVKDMIAGEADSVPGIEDAGEEPDLEGGPEIELGFEEDEIPGAGGDEAIAAAPPDDDVVDLDLEADGADEDAEPADEGSDPSEIDLGLEDGEEPDIELDEDGEETADGDAGAEAADAGSVGTDDADEDDLEGDDADGDESTPSDADDSDAERTTPDEPTLADDDTEDGDGEPTDETSETKSAESEPGAAFDGSVGARLATEIRRGTVDEGDLEVLRSELDLEPACPDVTKVEHLQSRVEEVAAYTDALEQFLDEQGTGEQLIEDFRAELASFEDDLAAMDDRLEETDSRVDGIETDVESLTDWTADLGDVADDVETVEDDLDDVDDGVEAVDERVDDFTDDVADLEAVREGLTDIRDWRDQLGSMFSDD